MAQSRNDAHLSNVQPLDRRLFLQGAALGIAGLAGIGAAAQQAFAAKASDATLAALSGAQAEYEAAMAELSAIGAQLEDSLYKLEECRGNLEATVAQIDELQASIATKQGELAEAQDVLYDRVNASYRAGNTEALDIILDSTSFDDFISRVYYATKVSDADAAAISTVKQIKAELESEEAQLQETRAYQEQLYVEQQQYTDDLSAAEAYYESYTASLSADVVALMAQAQAEYEASAQAEYEAYLAAQQAAEAAAAATTPTVTETRTETVVETVLETVVDEQTGQEQQVEREVERQVEVEVEVPVEPAPAADPTPEPTPEPAYVEPEPVYSGTGNHVPGALDAAFSYCGVPYVWGGSDPSGFDCSGLAMYCYGLCGYDIARTTYGQIAQIQAAGNWKSSMSELSPGDLVFPHTGHVGIYAGGGMMVHAPTPGDVVKYASVYAFYGGGCPV